MLREIFYGEENKALTSHEELIDAEPREVFIIACLLVPIIGIGFYPKIVTQIYDATTTKLAGTLRDAVPALASKRDNKRLASIHALAAPSLTK